MKFKILIVAGNYYKKISDSLIFCSKEKLKNYPKVKYKSKVMKFNADVIEVPGAFEVPVIISKNIDSYDGFIALGCVIKGKTPHFNFISEATINSIMNLSVTYKKPIGNGIITCLNKKQAIERSDLNKKNKGGEAAKALFSVLKILKNDTQWAPTKPQGYNNSKIIFIFYK